jgi:hypothetical protein
MPPTYRAEALIGRYQCAINTRRSYCNLILPHWGSQGRGSACQANYQEIGQQKSSRETFRGLTLYRSRFSPYFLAHTVVLYEKVLSFSRSLLSLLSTMLVPVLTLFSAFAFHALAAGNALATIAPCPIATITAAPPPITVTAQHQDVSTCRVVTKCAHGSCSRDLVWDTWTFVSTTIPFNWNGTAMQSTVVTDIRQPVTVSNWYTTIPILPTVTSNATGIFRGNATGIRPTGYQTPAPSYTTIARNWVVPYNQLGPLAIPGYGGSGLCGKCNMNEAGAREQAVTVTECGSDGVDPRCVKYVEHWVSRSSPARWHKTEVALTATTIVPRPGTYTFGFGQVAPPHTFTGPSSTWIAPGHPYSVSVTRTCTSAPHTFNIKTTITKTLTYTAPPSTRPGTATTACPFPTGPRPFPGFSKTSSTSWSPNTLGDDSARRPWLDWPTQSTPASTKTGPAESDNTGPPPNNRPPPSTLRTTVTSYRNSTNPQPTHTNSTIVRPILTNSNSSSSTPFPITDRTITLAPPVIGTARPSSSSPPTPSFLVRLEALNGTLLRRETRYIMFQGNGAFSTSDLSQAASFQLIGDTLYHDTYPVGAYETEGSEILGQQSPGRNVNGWSRTGNKLSFAPAKLGFCVTEGKAVIVQLTSKFQGDCAPYELVVDGVIANSMISFTTSTRSGTAT